MKTLTKIINYYKNICNFVFSKHKQKFSIYLKFRTLNILTFAFYTKFLINFLIPNSRYFKEYQKTYYQKKILNTRGNSLESPFIIKPSNYKNLSNLCFYCYFLIPSKSKRKANSFATSLRASKRPEAPP